mmetsp:Transcript_87951/g.179414  ORF Transcript_87951/g.179414 Transcript_87951/m.179414 type:complete len:426 (-) Transcript_87951:206-1483(-)
MKDHIDSNTFISRKRIRKNFNWRQSSRQWSLITPLQVLFVWLLAKAKIRYIIGAYTILLTLSLHYGAQNVRYIISDFRQKVSLRASLQRRQQPSLANVAYWSMSDAVKHDLQRKLAQLQWKDKDNIFHTKNFIQEAKDILEPYITSDHNIQQILKDLAADASPSSTSIDAIVFENLPEDPYVPPTPTDESVRSLHKPTYVSEAVLMAMGELAGTYTVGYKAETEYSNPWAHEGFPRPGPGGSALTSTSGTLNSHQDMSYQSVIPDLLGLICLREGDDPFVQTTLISIENIIQLLPSHVVSTLRQERFQITASTQWVDIGAMGKQIVHPRALLEGTSLHLPVNWDNMVGIDLEASLAVERLRQIMRDIKPTGVHLSDGVMVLFNNQKVVHGRTPYQNLKYDGSDRVVIRSYFVKELDEDGFESRII